jgi:hypothetical protein
MTTQDVSSNSNAQPFLLPIHLNALKFFSLEASQPNWQEVLRELSSLFGSAPNFDDLKKRYEEATEEFQIFGVPSEPKIVSKLLEPLHGAKSAYVLGNFLSCIALCGMVAEMVAILMYEVREFTINGKPLDEKTQKGVFSMSFERLGQDRKIEVLSALSMINEKERHSFLTVKTIRKNYLHYLSHPHDRIREDARTAFGATANLVVWLMGLGVAAGSMKLDQRFINYLKRIEFIKPEAESSE